MVYLFDTNAVSDLMRDHPRLTDRVSRVARPDQVIIVPVVRGEILHGIERLPIGRRRQQLQITAQRILLTFPCEPIVSAMADGFSRMKCEAETKGVAISDHDLWIAAAADYLNATVVSRDADLSRLSGTRVEDWTL
jgi:predicted nucleic acid-binding protein